MTDTNPSRNRPFSPERDRQDELRRTTMSNERFGPVNHTPLRFPRCRPGPNNWDNITPEEFGPEHDIELNDQGTIWLFTPISKAALQWCYAHLPDDAPRWGQCSYVVEHRFISDIVEGARRDGLLTKDDYEKAMAAEDETAHQGEDQ